VDDDTIADLNALAERLGTEGKSVGAVTIAGLRLVERLTEEQPDTRPQQILTGIPDADKALAEAAGVAQIAGVHGVDVDDVMEIAGLLLSMGLAFVA